MTNFDEMVPAHVRALGGYTPGKPVRQAEQESGVRCIKMASNENPFGPSPKALAAMQAAAAEQNFYPDNDNLALRERLAARHGVAIENLLVTTGSTSFLNIVSRTVLVPGLNAVTSERSFIVYPIVVKATGAKFVTVPMKNDTFDLEGILAAIDGNTRLVFIANPNNPTGTFLPPKEIERYLDRVPEHVVTVLDEAYADFAEVFARGKDVTYSRSIEYVRESRNVLVLRTFSKAQGLAGLRIGYGIAPAPLIAYCAKLRIPFAVSGMAEAAALAALDDREHLDRVLLNNTVGAHWLEEQIRKLGLRVVPTWSNFLYFEIEGNAAELCKKLQEAGVIVRPMGAWGIPNAIRVTIGTPDQNEFFIGALKKLVRA